MKNCRLLVLFIIVGCSSSSQNTTPTPDAGKDSVTAADATNMASDTAVLADATSAPDQATPIGPDAFVFADAPPVIKPDTAPDATSAPDQATPIGPDALALPDASSVANPDTAPDVSPINPDTAPVCGGYCLCGVNNSTCCGSRYFTVNPGPNGQLMLFPGGWLKAAPSTNDPTPPLYVYNSGYLIPGSPLALLEWSSVCTDANLTTAPTSSAGCSKVSQFAPMDLASFQPSLITVTNAQMPYRPGTVIIVNNGNKYVSSGIGTQRTLRKLNPPALADQMLLNGVKLREVTVDSVYMSMYAMGADITALVQYDPLTVCTRSIDAMMETLAIIAAQ